MAVYAADVTLPDLFLHRSPSSLCGHECHTTNLDHTVAMIEFEYDRICLTAANTRMQQQVLMQEASVRVAPLPHLHHRASDVVGAIREVMSPAEDRVTCPA